MWDKREPVRPAEHKHGSRLAIVFSGSPLFTGSAGSGESDIRKWIIENDWLEAIIALPEQMFYNTGIGTYIWIVTNRKEKRRKGKIQLVDARNVWTAGGSEDNKRSLGDKRRHITASQIAEIVQLYGRQADGEMSKVFDNTDFGYTRVTVERPLRLNGVEPNRAYTPKEIKALKESLDREENAPPVIKKIHEKNTAPDPLHGLFPINAGQAQGPAPTGSVPSLCVPSVSVPSVVGAAPRGRPIAVVEYEPDSDLRDFENVPLNDDIDAYFDREVRPHVPDAWMDRRKDKVGYEINFNRHFYKYTPPRPLEEIDAELKQAEEEIMRLLREVTE
jgi:type I restriction enzyme M protein